MVLLVEQHAEKAEVSIGGAQNHDTMERFAGFASMESLALRMHTTASSEARHCSHHSTLVEIGHRVEIQCLEVRALGILQKQPVRIAHYLALEAPAHVDCTRHVD
jgi:hypothetical protein